MLTTLLPPNTTEKNIAVLHSSQQNPKGGSRLPPLPGCNKAPSTASPEWCQRRLSREPGDNQALSLLVFQWNPSEIWISTATQPYKAHKVLEEKKWEARTFTMIQ